ncbi:mRNA-decapping enzyme-like protein [Linum grandiflorum]
MAQNGKLMPNLDHKTTKLLNLTVLQRIDPFIEEILITVAHVTLYQFNIDTSQWGRKDVEGSLFVVKRNAQPRFQFIVMNRRNTENLVENLLGDFEYEIQLPYLLYRNASQEVRGIWFYNPSECDDVVNLFNRILNAYSKVPANPNVVSRKSEFEEFEAVPNSSLIRGGLLEPPSTTVATEVPQDSSFEHFFSTAANIGNTDSGIANSRHNYHYPTSTIPVPSLTPQTLPHLLSSMSGSMVAVHDTPNSVGFGNRVASLVNPSLFSVQPSTSSSFMVPPTTSSVDPPQRSYGTSMPLPFPPPSTATPLVSRDKVRGALLKLVQFIDMFHRALTKENSY